MDPLSITASVIAVIQLTGVVIGYLNDVKDAPKECQQCTIEASNIQNLLINLRYRLEQGQAGDAWFTAVRAFNVENGPLDQCRQALEQLQSKVENQNGFQEIKRRLLWKFSKTEVAEILARMERLKSLVSIALEGDHFKLSQAIKNDTVLIRDALPTLKANTSAIRDAQNLQQHHAIMEWLSPTDYPSQQHDIITRRQEDTGQWFLDTSEFKRWVQGADKTLFCLGIPGAGKTMMAAIAIDHLCRTILRDDIGVAYLFCSYKAHTDQSASNLIATLLKQLVQNKLDIAAPVTQMYDLHSKRGSKPSFGDILQALRSVCSAYTTIYIVVDALDECLDRDGTRGQLIDTLHELQVRTDVRLLFTSRFIPEITQKFQSNPILEVRASEQDVRHFVVGQMPRLPSCIQRDEELRCVVQNKIVEAVDGMFLLARLHVDSLLDKRNKQKVLSTLNKLSKGSAALDDAYSDALERIDGQLAEDCLLAKRALSWISYAQRLLTTKELCHALAVELGDKALNNDNMYEVEDVISVCAGLVTVDEESDIIRLVHYTTQEYFERVRLEWNPGSQEEIAVACLTYLSFDTFRSGSCSDDEAFGQRLAKNPFFDYSAHYWSEHVRPVERATFDLALAFLRNEALVDCTAQGALTPSYKYKGYSERFPSRTSGLHLTATYGLLYLTKRLLIEKHGYINTGADSKDSGGQTPLSHAARYGHEAVVKLLVESGKVDVDSKDVEGWTPLSHAARYGHEEVVKLLLEREDVEADSKDKDSRTPLSLAAMYGHDNVVKLLLAAGKLNPEAEDTKYGRTPLSWAAGSGHTAVVKLLLAIDRVDADSKSNGSFVKGRSPLSYAAEGGHEAVMTLLLATGRVDPDSKDNEGRTPLSYAVSEARTETIKLLLGHAASPLTIDIKRKGMLHHAIPSVNCKLETVETLLMLGTPTNSTDIDNMKPLHYTIRFGRLDIAELLLRNGVSVDTAIQRKTWDLKRYEDRTAYEPLGKNRSSIAENRCSKGLTPLHYAALVGHSRMVQFFLDRGADPNALSHYDETPLHLALRRRLHGTEYRDDWTEDHWRAEVLLDIIDFEDGDAYEAAYNEVEELRISVIDALLSHQKTDSIHKAK